jgi:cytochrome c peroxidase
MKQVLIVISVFILACTKQDLMERFFGFKQPENFPPRVYKKEVTQAGFELGRKLFYEPRLSRNNTVSCGSCHIQSAAFTHHGHDISHGIDDRLGNRNATPIMNMAWHSTFMWDGGVFDLDLQPIVPITNVVEMDETIENVLNKLRNHPQYPELFKRAYGSTEITSSQMLKALSQFMVMLVSANSKYDSVKLRKTTFTEAEQQGYQVFQQQCNSCHQEPLFTDLSFKNNGIGPGPANDEGRGPITLNPADKFKFKVPSLRNLAYTAPYMHDGRFRSLDAVLNHYSDEVKNMPTLDPLLKNGIALTASEKIQLKAFLNTLNDKNFITDKRFAEQ